MNYVDDEFGLIHELGVGNLWLWFKREWMTDVDDEVAIIISLMVLMKAVWLDGYNGIGCFHSISMFGWRVGVE